MSNYKSIRVPINHVIPGMELAKPVLTDEGKIALSEGTYLNAGLIIRLKHWGIMSLDIRELAPDDAEERNKPSPSQQKFYSDYDKTVDTVKKSFQLIRDSNTVPFEECQKLVDKDMELILESPGVINHLHMVNRQGDEYTFHHSVNVAVVAGVLGKWLEYDQNEINNLMLAGLLHDIGKVKVPLKIVNKPAKLSVAEMEIMKQHTIYGYQLIRDIPNISQKLLLAVLQHHERMDGCGYPFQIKGDRIHPYARIIAIADMYDAMTSDRVYQPKTTPFNVVELIVKEMFNKLDPAICTIFLNNVRDYFIGNVVQLSDGREAEVVYVGQFVAARPVVRTQAGEFIDLEKRKELSVVKLIEA
ncbi:MAG: HD-GYP domain-containing protein [Veillonellales bacterium]